MAIAKPTEPKPTLELIDDLSEDRAQFCLKALLVAGKLAENEIRSIVEHALKWIPSGDS